MSENELRDLMKEITRHIHTMENGVMADDMKRLGMSYHRQFGVSIVQLRQMAKNYPTDAALAQLLWDKNWRETRIMATLMMPKAELNEAIAREWAGSSDFVEITEQLALNLLSQTEAAFGWMLLWLQVSDAQVNLAAFLSIAHMSLRRRDLSARDFEQFLDPLFTYAAKPDGQNWRALALALRRLGRKSKSLHQTVLAQVKGLNAANNQHIEWLQHDVLTELEDPAIVELIEQ